MKTKQRNNIGKSSTTYHLHCTINYTALQPHNQNIQLYTFEGKSSSLYMAKSTTTGHLKHIFQILPYKTILHKTTI